MNKEKLSLRNLTGRNGSKPKPKLKNEENKPPRPKREKRSLPKSLRLNKMGLIPKH